MENINILSNHSINQTFHLKKYGYTLDRVLNNQNRWDTKIVYSIFDRDLRHGVSTTYVKEHDYLKLLEATTFLECKGKLSPNIIALYPGERTVICDYIGMFLQDYLLENPQGISTSMNAVFHYIRDLNEINKQKRRFIIPSIIEALFELSKELDTDFDFMPRSKDSFCSFIKGEGLHELEKEYEIINVLDEKVASLAKKLLNRKERILKRRQKLNKSRWKTINLLDVAVRSGMIGSGN